MTRCRSCIASLALVAVLAPPSPGGARAEEAHCHDHAAPPPGAPGRPARDPLARSVKRYAVPRVTLLDQDGRSVQLRDVLAPDRPVALNFIFTTCTTICPVMSATFAGLRERLGDGDGGLRMISITIDPEHDRPAVLKAYARRFGADPAWSFYTGSPEEVRNVLTAFEALAGDKVEHRPVTLLRSAHGEEWVRLDGLAGAGELAAVLRPLLAQNEP